MNPRQSPRRTKAVSCGLTLAVVLAPHTAEVASADPPADVPDWWRNTDSFYCPCANSGAGSSLLHYISPMLRDKIASFDELPKLLDEARQMGSDVVYLVDYWQGGYENKGDYEPYAELGGADDLGDALRAETLRQPTGHVRHALPLGRDALELGNPERQLAFLRNSRAREAQRESDR